MATVTLLATINTSTGSGPYTSGSFTPTGGGLLVLSGMASGVTTAGTPTASANGLTFARDTNADALRASVDGHFSWVAEQATPGSPSSMTISYNPGGGPTGSIVFIYEVTGLTRVGLIAIRQADGSNGASGGTPSGTFDAAALTGNPIIGTVINATNPAGLTIPGSFAAEDADVGYNTPSRGGHAVHRNSGHTSATVTWGSTSASAWSVNILELDTSAPPAVTGTGAVTAPAATASGAGGVALDGSAAVTSPTADADAAASVIVAGTATVTAPAAQASGEGELSFDAVGSGAVVAPAATAAGSGALWITGTGAATAPAAAADAAGSVTITGTGGATAPAAETIGTGNLTLTGDGTLTAPAAVASGAALVGTEIFGAGAFSAPAAQAAGTGTIVIAGVGEAVAPPAEAIGYSHAPARGGRLHKVAVEQRRHPVTFEQRRHPVPAESTGA